jgi:lipopolysaccharide transport system ATP-binding protein
MSDVVIRAENLSKLYRINATWQRYETLREQVVDGLRRTFRLDGQARPRMRDLWALKDVSLQVQQGEVVGLIGRNGAGKSTLLKIFTRITEPTMGFARIHGRVGSLLEVGTGFHAELSGRENVYLNGAILGMKKKEIDARFDEIVAFSEIEEFIDTPVKRYSSGMSVRLAFAVAAHLEPEILLVDEVLAVGDAAFQKKCLGKMGDVAQHGRTVLLVSHNMTAIQSLCTRVVLLDHGQVVFDGPTDEAVKRYLAMAEDLRAQALDAREDRTGGYDFRFTAAEFLDPRTMKPATVLVAGQPVLIRLHFRNLSNRVLENLRLGINFFTNARASVFACSNTAVGAMRDVLPGEGYADCLIPKWNLNTGRYAYHLFAGAAGMPVDFVRDAGAVDVEAGDYYGTGQLPGTGRESVLVDYSWSTHEGTPVQARESAQVGG